MATATTTTNNNDNTLHKDLFSSLISDIKSYTGKDPLLPWLRGIKKMKESLPTRVLNEKLPRFLQKCTQAFETDRRYRNDLRYIRVLLQLMDFVDDPRAVLQTMEKNKIGMKKSLFYQAYALYYEKKKNFEEAEKMYHLGVQNLADPVDELQKSYDQFLQRVDRRRKKKIQQCQEQGAAKRPLSPMNIPPQHSETEENNEAESKKIPEKICQNKKPPMESNHNRISAELCNNEMNRSTYKQREISNKNSDESRMFCGENTIVVKFVDTAVVGKSEAEDVCHHGLVDPTINMKGAMNAINSMFREPLETAPVGRKSSKNQQKENHHLSSGFEVFIDENLDNGMKPSSHTKKGFSLMQNVRAQTCQPLQEPFKIFDDDEDSCDNKNNDEEVNLEKSEVQSLAEGSISSCSRLNAFVFPDPRDLTPESSVDRGAGSSSRSRFREDTVVHRFVGSTIVDEPEVENACHHGLVDPTINLKEAMEDINSMFGKPIDFVRARRTKKLDKAPAKNQDFSVFSILPDDGLEPQQDQPPPKPAIKPSATNQDFCGFSILPDDDLEPQQDQPPPKTAKKSNDSDLFEPTVFTKEAMDEINKMFGMPLDF